MDWPGIPFPYSSLFNIRKKIPDNLVSSAVQNLPNLPFRQDPYPGMTDPTWGPESTFPAATPKPSGGSFWGDKDEDFWDALKEQLEGAGEDYDKSDQPFKSLTPTKSRGQVPVPKPLMPSLMGGTPTGASYNPYLAKRKRAQ